jgi:hypothetical protein
MQLEVTRFKSMHVALKELERFIRDGEHLQTGKPFRQMHDLRSREALGNWLLCAAVNHGFGRDRLIFSSDPRGGDGIIQDTEGDTTWDMEHVIVPASREGSAQDEMALIQKAIQDKQNKGGRAYASGKTLVVFSNARGGEWYPNRVGRALPEPLDFDAVWVVCLQGVVDGGYTYGVTRLERTHSPVWRVHIAPDFGSWTVEPVQ